MKKDKRSGYGKDKKTTSSKQNLKVKEAAAVGWTLPEPKDEGILFTPETHPELCRMIQEALDDDDTEDL